MSWFLFINFNDLPASTLTGGKLLRSTGCDDKSAIDSNLQMIVDEIYEFGNGGIDLSIVKFLGHGEIKSFVPTKFLARALSNLVSICGPISFSLTWCSGEATSAASFVFQNNERSEINVATLDSHLTVEVVYVIVA